MRRRAVPIAAWCLSLISSAALPGPGASQEAENVLGVSFSRVSARPGESFALPVFVKSDRNLQDSFRLVVEFSTEVLTFEEARLAKLGSRAGWKISGKEEAIPGFETRKKLVLEVDSSEATFFPSGVVAYVGLKLSDHAREGDLRLKATVEGLPEGWKAEVSPAQIRVYTRPTYGCFFYMH